MGLFVLIAALSALGMAGPSLAASAAQEQQSAEQSASCPPDVKGEPPTVGQEGSEPLSDKLAQSKGVICPPASVDPQMEVNPPGGGRLKVIPPPGARPEAIKAYSRNSAAAQRRQWLQASRSALDVKRRKSPHV
jgi:hypothetical protein